MVCSEDLIIELTGILIDNAIKHCDENGKVFVNLSKKNKQIILEVKNTGLNKAENVNVQFPVPAYTILKEVKIDRKYN